MAIALRATAGRGASALRDLADAAAGAAHGNPSALRAVPRHVARRAGAHQVVAAAREGAPSGKARRVAEALARNDPRATATREAGCPPASAPGEMKGGYFTR